MSSAAVVIGPLRVKLTSTNAQLALVKCLSFCVKVFYVIGKALSGKPSCTQTGINRITTGTDRFYIGTVKFYLSSHNIGQESNQ